MRPALQRLIKRPSSLELLRYLISTTYDFPTSRKQRCPYRPVTNIRRQTHTALGRREVQGGDQESYNSGQKLELFKPLSTEPVTTDPEGRDLGGRSPAQVEGGYWKGQDLESFQPIAIDSGGAGFDSQCRLSKKEKKSENSNSGSWDESYFAGQQIKFESELEGGLDAMALEEAPLEEEGFVAGDPTRSEVGIFTAMSKAPTSNRNKSDGRSNLESSWPNFTDEGAKLQSLRRISKELTSTDIFEIQLPSTDYNSTPWKKRKKKRKSFTKLEYGPWDESNWTRDQIEFESNLEEDNLTKPKLLNNPTYQRDLRLWLCLLNYRQRIYGPEAVRMYWQAVRNGTFELPVTGPFARKLWLTFLNLGFEDDDILNQIWNHASEMLGSSGKRWPPLYTTIVQHMLLFGRGEEAKLWHDRLFQTHPPVEGAFIELSRMVAHKGDLDAFAYIYKKNNVRTIYSRFIQILCKKEDYGSAAKWHFILISYGDSPKTAKEAEPLVHFMAAYDHQMAVDITQSLVRAGVSFASTISPISKPKNPFSRELMNLVHGDVHQIPVKEYNDSLGARWFATRWISLDVAISGIRALGIRQIGPLSLQAIALRDSDAVSVAQRIDQLAEFEISIGQSLFSRAVEKFARAGNQEFLDGLLVSDQHPDALEDQELQDKLLLSYRRLQDWSNYRRTLEIGVIGSKYPEIEAENMILRSYINPEGSSDMLASLRKMQISGTPVKAETIFRIISEVLQHRRTGHRPVKASMSGQQDDLMLAITILRDIIHSGSFVPPIFWREIIKRLGMLGRFNELEDLCEFLASKYGPANRSQLQRYRIPEGLPATHPLHPFHILFESSFQAAVVEWGIIKGVRSKQSQSGLIYPNNTPQVTAGIELLKRLHRYGVHINIGALRRAILNRLIIYYGPGVSNRRYNRVDRAHNPLNLNQMASQIDMALGRSGTVDPRLKDAVESSGGERLLRRTRRQRRVGTARDSAFSLPLLQ